MEVDPGCSIKSHCCFPDATEICEHDYKSDVNWEMGKCLKRARRSMNFDQLESFCDPMNVFLPSMVEQIDDDNLSRLIGISFLLIIGLKRVEGSNIFVSDDWKTVVNTHHQLWKKGEPRRHDHACLMRTWTPLLYLCTCSGNLNYQGVCAIDI